MDRGFQLFPEQGATASSQVDLLYLTLVGITVLFTGLICVLILFFMVRYRSSVAVNREISMTRGRMFLIEAGWSLVPLVIVMAIFVWGAYLYFLQRNPPREALDIYVVGKQWMWKVQHTSGRREINTLHVPAGQPVRLLMISEDVIHSFYLPAFRSKMDVLPGRYTSQWFEPTMVGEHHLFCAEYCGTDHSQMVGKVVVQSPEDYAAWLESGPEESAASQGRRLFARYHCNECHTAEGGSAAPRLLGLPGQTVRLQDGQTVVADAQYIRESIRAPDAKRVAGYAATMPPYPQLTEEEIVLILAYLSDSGNSQTSERP